MIVLEDPRAGKFILRKTRTRGIRLSLAANGWLEVRMSRPSKFRAKAFVSSNQKWLAKHYDKPVVITDGTNMGKYIVNFIKSTKSDYSIQTSKNKKTIQVQVPVGFDVKDPLLQLDLYKCCVRTLTVQYESTIREKVKTISSSVDLEPNSIRVRPMSSRWGSCTSRGDVTISTFSVQLNENLFRYLVLHELAHLKHHNHSAKFWGYLANFHSNYKSDRKKLALIRPVLELN